MTGCLSDSWSTSSTTKTAAATNFSGEGRTVTIQPPTQATSWRFLCRFHDAGGMHGGLAVGRVGPERLALP